jgi:hypothetical protein
MVLRMDSPFFLAPPMSSWVSASFTGQETIGNAWLAPPCVILVNYTKKKLKLHILFDNAGDGLASVL